MDHPAPDDIKKLLETINNLDKEKNEKNEDLKSENEDLKSENEDLSYELEGVRFELEDLKSELEDLKSELEEEKEDSEFRLNEEIGLNEKKEHKINKFNDCLEEISKHVGYSDYGDEECEYIRNEGEIERLAEFIGEWIKPRLDISAEISHNLRTHASFNDDLKKINFTGSKIAMLMTEVCSGDKHRIENYNRILKFLDIHRVNVNAMTAFKMIIDYFSSGNQHWDDEFHIIITLKDGSCLYLTQMNI